MAPIYSFYFERSVKSFLTGQGQMEDFEVQLLLDAKRWVVEVPADKDGWVFGLETESDGQVRQGGGANVPGGSTIVVLVRQNRESKRIEYAWYAVDTLVRSEELGPVSMTFRTRSTGSGSVQNPLAEASVSTVRQEGRVDFGDAILRGGRHEVQALPSAEKGEFEVRLVLRPPHDSSKKEEL